MALPAMLDDYLFLGAVLQERIRAQLGEDLVVGSADELAQALGGNLARTTAFVVWNGERVSDDARGGASAMLQQRWLVLLGVKNASQQPGARNKNAGPLLARLHKAIAGWTPDGVGRPFKRATGNAPSYTPGAGWFPLTFSISLSL